MVVWTRLHRFSAIAAGAGAGLATYYYHKLTEKENVVQNSWTTIDHKNINPCSIWDKDWDCRDPKSLVRPPKNDSAEEQNRYNAAIEACRPKATRHIILVRHGEYLDVGEEDDTHRLTARGRAQATLTGKRLKELNITWDSVIASTMVRAQETANLVLNEIDFDPKIKKNCPYLREGAPIPPQPPVGHWKPESSQFFRDGARIEAAFRRYFHRANAKQEHDSYTLIVGHGNVIRYFVCRALQFPTEAWLRLSINHASITWLSIGPTGRVTIKSLGDSGHIPANLLTYKIPRDSGKFV